MHNKERTVTQAWIDAMVAHDAKSLKKWSDKVLPTEIEPSEVADKVASRLKQMPGAKRRGR